MWAGRSYFRFKVRIKDTVVDDRSSSAPFAKKVTPLVLSQICNCHSNHLSFRHRGAQIHAPRLHAARPGRDCRGRALARILQMKSRETDAGGGALGAPLLPAAHAPLLARTKGGSSPQLQQHRLFGNSSPGHSTNRPGHMRATTPRAARKAAPCALPPGSDRALVSDGAMVPESNPAPVAGPGRDPTRPGPSGGSRVGSVAGVARVEGRQNAAAPAGSRVAEKMMGSPFESKSRHSHLSIGLAL